MQWRWMEFSFWCHVSIWAPNTTFILPPLYWDGYLNTQASNTQTIHMHKNNVVVVFGEFKKKNLLIKQRRFSWTPGALKSAKSSQQNEVQFSFISFTWMTNKYALICRTEVKGKAKIEEIQCTMTVLWFVYCTCLPGC